VGCGAQRLYTEEQAFGGVDDGGVVDVMFL
jgi:hypothetical protein